MKLYHFLNEKYALQAIKHQMLKVSLLNDLNDPFELLAPNIAKSEDYDNFVKLKKKLSAKVNLLCFSESWHNPLMWSHYADKHKGVALEFESDEELQIVKYRNDRINYKFKDLLNDDKLAIEVLSTKYCAWCYEEERRFFLSKKEVVECGEFLFYKFTQNLQLTGVIAGALSSISRADIISNLPCGKEIKFIKSKLATDSFKIILEKDEKDEKDVTIKGKIDHKKRSK